MVREKPKEFYKAKPVKFGNGAKLKAFKAHIDKEMIIMTKKYWKKIMKDKDVSDKESDRNDKAIAKMYIKIEDKANDDLIKDLKQ